MNLQKTPSNALVDASVDTKIKLAAFWAATLFCYVYGDYFELYLPGKLGGMLQGKMQPMGDVTQGVLFGTSLMMVIPSLMVALSIVLKARINRWVNIFMGAVYTLIMAVVIPGTWLFYKFFGVVEMGLTVAIVWMAWTWPKQS